MTCKTSKRRLLASASTFGILTIVAAQAQQRSFNIPSEEAVKAIPEFARQAGIQIVSSADQLSGVKTVAVSGALDTHAALKLLLSGTGIEVASDDGQTIVLKAEPKNAQAASKEAAPNETAPTEQVVVTGTHLASAPITSELLVITAEEMKAEGSNDLGDVIRKLPQNYSGGQNPGIAYNVPGLVNGNQDGSSGLDLRGLGPDATLTLLNGRRLSYDAFNQAVDISAIPIAAIDSLQIVPEGSSAIYGSDAVGGVANVILKKDYDGLTLSARAGGATDGGDFQQQYDAVGGTTWANGGFIATYEFGRNDKVYGNQRDFTKSYLSAPYSLYPSGDHHSAIVSAHEQVAPWAEFTIDALYTLRDQQLVYNIQPAYLLYDTSREEMFSISPTLKVELPLGWSASINGTLGSDQSRTTGSEYLSSANYQTTHVCDCNTQVSSELEFTGPAFELPAGLVQIAVGGGYLRNSFFQAPIYGARSDYYAYGETAIPIISPEMGMLVRSLALDAAVRFESYSDMGNVATPKIGAELQTDPDLAFKASWGQSFKAPTLSQEYMASYTYLDPAAALGATGYPSTATTFLTIGGSKNLSPEKASTWSFTGTYHPVAIPGFQAEISYFNIHYTDRVERPIASLVTAFSTPANQQFILYNPTVAQQQAAIASSALGLLTSAGYNSSNVIAIIDDAYTNAAIQKVQGIDLSGSYSFSVNGDEIAVKGSGSWLESTQKNSLLGPQFDLAGTIFEPAHFRGRAGASWSHDGVSINSYVNYIGGVTNNTTGSYANGAHMITIDLTANYKLQTDFAGDFGLLLSVQNITDQAPPFLKSTAVYNPDYDTTNYSGLGRLVSLSITKSF